MNTKHIDGIVFEKMLRNGLANLRNNEKSINSLNVFPVADADTGTNMLITLENGLAFARSKAPMGAYLKQLSDGMILGARGNSGVILSQLFKGLFNELSHCGRVNTREMKDALVSAYKCAYNAVRHPVEGTILTVAKEGIEYSKRFIDKNTSMEQLFEIYLACLKKSLERTTELLPQLSRAGVVDSGAKGYVLIVEGMLRCLYGEIIETEFPGQGHAPVSACISSDIFNSRSKFELGYCMEFVLQLMESEGYNRVFKLDNYISEIDRLGSSLVAVCTDGRLKVHVHTLKPARIITLSQEYGEFISFKLENMQIQHNEELVRNTAADSDKNTSLRIIVWGSGGQYRRQMLQLGCDEFVTDEKELAAAVEKTGGGAAVLLAESNMKVSLPDNVTVIPTQNLADRYLALAMDISDEADSRRRIASMRHGTENVLTLTVEEPEELRSSLEEFAAGHKETAELETMVVFAGERLSDTGKLGTILEEFFPDTEINIFEGGQDNCLELALS